MAVEISVATTSRLGRNPFLGLKPTSPFTPTSLFIPSIRRQENIFRCRKKTRLTVCFVVEEEKLSTEVVENRSEETVASQISAARVAEKLARKRSERLTYLVAAVMSSFGITSMAVMAVYYRFSWQMEVNQSSGLLCFLRFYIFLSFFSLLEI